MSLPQDVKWGKQPFLFVIEGKDNVWRLEDLGKSGCSWFYYITSWGAEHLQRDAHGMETSIWVSTISHWQFAHRVWWWQPLESSVSCIVVQSCPTLVTLWTATCQAPLSMELSKQEYRSRLSFPSPGNFPDPGVKPASPALASRIFTTEPPGKPQS